MESQISNIDVTITPIMVAMAVFVSFAIQFIKALLNRLAFFGTDEIKKSFFPMISITLTIGAFFLAGVENFLLAGVVMGLSASGGYTMLNGSAGLAKKNGTKPQEIAP